MADTPLADGTCVDLIDGQVHRKDSLDEIQAVSV